MKKELILSLFLVAAMPNIIAQDQQQNPKAENMMPQQSMSTFQQVDKIRKALNLDQKQFEKAYKAYESYNKAIFGDSNQSGPSMPMGGGRRGGMGGPGGGMGGPGGGMGGPGGGMGGPGGDMGGQRPDMSQDQGSMPKPPKEMSEKDMEKLHKKMQKQETKLRKSMRKLLKDDSVYARWEEMRQAETMPPKR
jgi:hypothetical protein